METTANSTAQHLTMVPTPSRNGVFSILEDGYLIGYPESSAISMWSYFENTLTVTYTANDKMYHYKDVPFTVIAQMLTAESVGKFINVVVKPNYKFIG
jgi:hypothetical protein